MEGYNLKCIYLFNYLKYSFFGTTVGVQISEILELNAVSPSFPY